MRSCQSHSARACARYHDGGSCALAQPTEFQQWLNMPGTWDYSGIQIPGIGANMDTVSAGGGMESHVIRNNHFAGFDGTDECGMRSVAITNQKAGVGKGMIDDTYNWCWGHSICSPIYVSGLSFRHIEACGSPPVQAKAPRAVNAPAAGSAASRCE